MQLREWVNAQMKNGRNIIKGGKRTSPTITEMAKKGQEGQRHF